MQHFDGDVAIMLEIMREVHGGHAAGAELGVDTIAVRKDALKSRASQSYVRRPS